VPGVTEAGMVTWTLKFPDASTTVEPICCDPILITTVVCGEALPLMVTV
jgi:hypothetical protein